MSLEMHGLQSGHDERNQDLTHTFYWACTITVLLHSLQKESVNVDGMCTLATHSAIHYAAIRISRRKGNYISTQRRENRDRVGPYRGFFVIEHFPHVIDAIDSNNKLL